MLIDWFTVGAQVLNFIVLVGLMKHFLYKPVLDAIDAREKRIASQLADADKKKAAALGDRDELKQKNDAFDQQRAALLQKATAEAGAERQNLMDAAHKAADALTASHQQKMASDAKELGQALRQRTQDEVFAVARKALTDLATAGLEASACELFIARLHVLEGPALGYMAAALKASKDGALVRTAFELPAAQRAAVHKAVNDVFAMKVSLHYEVAPQLVSGIELSANGQKFAWSIAGYLASLERGVSELLKPPAKQDKPDKAPKTTAVAAAPEEPAAAAAPEAPEAPDAPAPRPAPHPTPQPPAKPTRSPA
jgi:F-type H+-transporting ATPase subunit b